MASTKPGNKNDSLASFSLLNIGTKAEGTTNLSKQTKPAPAGLDAMLSSPPPLAPRSDFIKVKTRSTYREPYWNDIYPRLYLFRMLWLYPAKHTSGVFRPIEKISLTDEAMRPCMEMMDRLLGKWKNLSKAMLEVVRRQGEGVLPTSAHQGGQ